MTASIAIDDSLIEEATRLTGLTKEEAVELALETLVRLQRQKEIRTLKGKLRWEDNWLGEKESE